MNHEHDDGLNLGYGHIKSDSREGSMARRTAIAMGEDLYKVYMLLSNHDDLPEWCHYKLATSQAYLSDVSDYISSKIVKKYLDSNMNMDDLRDKIRKALEIQR